MLFFHRSTTTHSCINSGLTPTRKRKTYCLRFSTTTHDIIPLTVQSADLKVNFLLKTFYYFSAVSVEIVMRLAQADQYASVNISYDHRLYYMTTL